MNLSWEPSSDESQPVAVAREVAQPSNYRLVYMTRSEDGSEQDPDSVLPAASYVASSAGGLPVTKQARSEPSGFGAAKISLPPGNKWQFEPLPPPAGPDDKIKREIFVVTGPSGSGKSYWIRSYVRNYLKLFPKHSVFLISSLSHDDTLDAVKELQRIDTDKLVANPPKDVKTWTNSLLLIDDVEGLDAAKAAAVQRVQDMVASEGRHTGTTLIRASHLSTDYKRTRLLLQEAHGFILFPQAGAHSQYTYLLTKYGGMEKKVVANLLATPTRWILVHHTAPRYVLTPSTIYLLS